MRTSEMNTNPTSKRFNDQLSINELRARLRRLDQQFKECDQYGAALPEDVSETEYFDTEAMYQSALDTFTVRSTTISNLTAVEASFKFPRLSIPRFDEYHDILQHLSFDLGKNGPIIPLEEIAAQTITFGEYSNMWVFGSPNAPVLLVDKVIEVKICLVREPYVSNIDITHPHPQAAA
ncbi:hypothetical protein AVEN_117126-1 [Araneus ventricosus]|uniref:Uncharacterized protein n=1 Tax=Araneus ventricosus TaxID=182803 RepID=A0A4Y2SUW4_ARAVE|nr:hypothetical protein AVEN_117126-1 [Araneus ventricosus]